MIKLGFCDIGNNQGLGKCNQPRPDLDYSGDHKNLIHLLFIITYLYCYYYYDYY